MFDENRRLIYDDNRNGTERFGGASIVLAEGESYTVQVTSPGAERHEETVRVRRDMKPVSIVLEARKTDAR